MSWKPRPLVTSATEGKLGRQRLDRLGEIYVAAGETAVVLGGEDDVYPVPDIGPVGMVVGAFGGKGDPGHEAERLIEIAELEAALDSVTLRIESPIAQLLERRLAPGCVSLGHPRLPYWRPARLPFIDRKSVV